MTITPAKYNDLVIYQGATFTEVLSFTDSENNIIDLTGFRASMKIRKSYLTQTIIDLNTENDKITLEESLGKLTLSIPANETKILKSGNYIYNLELIQDDKVDRYLQGSIFISAEVK